MPMRDVQVLLVCATRPSHLQLELPCSTNANAPHVAPGARLAAAGKAALRRPLDVAGALAQATLLLSESRSRTMVEAVAGR